MTCDKINKVAKLAETMMPIAGTPFRESCAKTGGNKCQCGRHRNLTHEQGPTVESSEAEMMTAMEITAAPHPPKLRVLHRRMAPPMD